MPQVVQALLVNGPGDGRRINVFEGMSVFRYAPPPGPLPPFCAQNEPPDTAFVITNYRLCQCGRTYFSEWEPKP